MRRAMLLAVALVLATATTAQADGVPSVTGTYGYGSWGSTVTIDAHGGEQPGGTIAFSTGGGWFNGVVTCVTVVGQDAWVAGDITSSDGSRPDTFWMARVHDGGPGMSGDLAMTFGSTKSFERTCEKAGDRWTKYMAPLVSGDLTVQ